MPYGNLNAMLTDSPSPALIIPSRYIASKHSIKIYYRQLRHLIESLINLSPFTHFTPQSCIAIALPNSIEFVITFFAILGIRGVVHPLNPNSSSIDEIERTLRLVKAKGVIVSRSEGKAVREGAKKLNIPVWEIWCEIKRDSLGKEDSIVHIAPIEGQRLITLNSVLDMKRDEMTPSPQDDDIALIAIKEMKRKRPKGASNVTVSSYSLNSIYFSYILIRIHFTFF